MNIGQASVKSGLPVKTLRYYEEIGLVRPARTEGNDYRDYSASDVEHLRFLQRARAVGFSLNVCRELLDLYRDDNRRCSQVKALVLEKVEQVEKQLHELQALRSVLIDMADSCAGDDSSNCSIIETLAQPAPAIMPFTLVE
ncbi:MAG: MerR family transcriptional regulator [Gammaproteobacteria bacterium]|nr:MAG: MerR family transcriptional regulator [Gammaproteobacteria bacterium]